MQNNPPAESLNPESTVMKTKSTKKPAVAKTKTAAALKDLPTRKNPAGGRMLKEEAKK